MIISVVKRGKGKGDGPINYLLSDKDHSGSKRKDKPEILYGSPGLTREIINRLDGCFKNKYLSVVFSFRDNEFFDKAAFSKILDRFHGAVFAGLEKDCVNYLAVRHGQHVHLVIPRTTLPIAGKSYKGGMYLNGHPPGQKNIKLWNLVNVVINYENGWDQVREKYTTNPKFSKYGNIEYSEFKREIGKYCSQLVETEQVNSRSELVSKLVENGIIVHRIGKDYLSVRLGSMDKSVKLKGVIYKDASDYQVCKNDVVNKSNSKFTNADYVKARLELGGLIEDRRRFNGRYVNKGLVGPEIKNNYNKEVEYGQKYRNGAGNFGYAKPNSQLNSITTELVVSSSGIKQQVNSLSEYAEPVCRRSVEARVNNRKNAVRSSHTEMQSGECSQTISNESGIQSDISIALESISNIESQLRMEINKLSYAKSSKQKSVIQSKINDLMARLEMAKMAYQEQSRTVIPKRGGF